MSGKSRAQGEERAWIGGRELGDEADEHAEVGPPVQIITKYFAISTFCYFA